MRQDERKGFVEVLSTVLSGSTAFGDGRGYGWEGLQLPACTAIGLMS